MSGRPPSMTRRSERCGAVAAPAAMSKKCAIAARHRVSPAQRRSLSAVCSTSVGSARPHVRRAPRHRAPAGRRDAASPSSASGLPPRHQTSGRQARESQRGDGVVQVLGPQALRVRRRDRARGSSARGSSPSEIRIARTPTSASCSTASAASASRSCGPTTTIVAVSARPAARLSSSRPLRPAPARSRRTRPLRRAAGAIRRRSLTTSSIGGHRARSAHRPRGPATRRPRTRQVGERDSPASARGPA